MRWGGAWLGAWSGAALCAALTAGAQAPREALLVQGRALPDFPLARPEAPVLTLDQERLFAGSEFGRRVVDELEAASEELARENRAIEAELVAEETELTERRSELPPAEFRALAEAFDEKAVGYRRQQDAKARALQRRDEAERQAFFEAAAPILRELVAELGAVAILDDRAVLFAAPAIDVTDRAIARVDAEIGAGEDLSPAGPVLPEDPAPVGTMPEGEGGADPGAPLPDPDLPDRGDEGGLDLGDPTGSGSGAE